MPASSPKWQTGETTALVAQGLGAYIAGADTKPDDFHRIVLGHRGHELIRRSDQSHVLAAAPISTPNENSGFC